MNILLLYASTEGQTKKIIERIASLLHREGHEVLVHSMASGQPVPPIHSFDAVICAASVHQGYHQESAIDFVSAQAAHLRETHAAFISVSLSAAMADGEEEARQYADRFFETTGWKPAWSLLLGGAIRLSGYDYFERQVMKYILRQKGVTESLTSDYECTNWAALETFVRDFLAAAPTKDRETAAGGTASGT
jgi:menaquinone-dependent protoporphyrinogen oxidase